MKRTTIFLALITLVIFLVLAELAFVSDTIGTNRTVNLARLKPGISMSDKGMFRQLTLSARRSDIFLPMAEQLPARRSAASVLL